MPDESLTLTAAVIDEMTAPLRGIETAVNRVAASVDRLARKAGQDGEQGMTRLERSTQRLHQSLGRLDTRLNTISGRLSGAFATGIRRAVTGFAALTAAVGVFGIKSASNIQQTQLAFETLLGSADKGRALFKEIQTLNLKTPFELKDLAGNTQLLLRYGVAGDQVVSVIKSLADAAALTQAPAENLSRLSLAVGQVVSKGKLQGEEARQLNEAGINAYDLFAAKLGKTRAEVEKLGEAGKLSSAVFLQGLINLDGPLAKVRGGAEKMSTTLTGQLSNVKDALNVGLADAANPLVTQLGSLIGTPDRPGALVGGLTALVSVAGPPLFSLIGSLAGLLSQVLPAAAPILSILATSLERLVAAAGPALQGLGPIGGEIGKSLVDLTDALVPVMPDLVRLFGAFLMILPDFIRLLAAMTPLVGPIAGLLTTLLGFGPVRSIVAGLLAGLLGYRALSGVIGTVWEMVAALRALSAAQAAQSALPGPTLPGAGKAGGTGSVSTKILSGFLKLLPAIAGASAIREAWSRPTKGGGAGQAGTALGFIAGGAGIGATAGLLGGPFAPITAPFGALAGAGLGGVAYGLHKVFGDVAPPRRLGSTLALDRSVAGSGGPGLTSSWRTFGIVPGSGHAAGSAVDRAGSWMGRYREGVLAAGGWATQHGEHVHADYGDVAPAGRSAGGGMPAAWGGAGGPLVVVHGNVYGMDELDGYVQEARRRQDDRDRRRDRSVQGVG